MLRDELGGRLVLSQSQRDDLRRVLGGGDLDRRLGLLPGSAPEERRSAAQAGAEHWRALVNTGRITFTARAAAAAAETAYEQLWSESGG